MRIDLPSCSFKYCRYNSDCSCTAKNKRESCEFERYKKSSEKMIPKKPINTPDCVECEKEDCEGCLSFKYGFSVTVCPNCKKLVENSDNGGIETYHYCPNCGQALDWNFESE